MECPKCGKTNDKVIDSRPTKDEISIRRRRQCLACSTRFTTYEATEESLFLVLLRQNTGQGSDLSSLKEMLSFMGKTLYILSEETEMLADKVNILEIMKSDEKPEQKPKKMPKKAVSKKTKSRKKAPVSKKTARQKLKPGRKAPARKKIAARRKTEKTATDTVLKIIKRYKKGVGISELKEKTRFEDRKIRNVLHHITEQGKIKRVGQGIYARA